MSYTPPDNDSVDAIIDTSVSYSPPSNDSTDLDIDLRKTSYVLSFQSVSIPTNVDGVTCTVREDEDSDGVPETSDVVSLVDGQTSYITADVFEGTGAVQLDFDIESGSDLTTTAELVGRVDVSVRPRQPRSVLISSSTTAGQLTIDWDAVSPADGYVVYRAEETGSNPIQYSEVANVSTPPYIDAELEDGEQYYYRISAYTT